MVVHPVLKHMERRKELAIDEVLSGSYSSNRINLFRIKGISCVTCGIEGVFFAEEKHRKGQSGWHLNLYAKRKDGSILLMTVDHIIPKSKGGAHWHVDNLQPMCAVCNRHKGDSMPKRGMGLLSDGRRPLEHMSNYKLRQKINKCRKNLERERLIYKGRLFSLTDWFKRIKRLIRKGKGTILPNRNNIRDLVNRLARLEGERELRRLESERKRFVL